MKLNKIHKVLLWAVLTIYTAFLTLLYPIVNKETDEGSLLAIQYKKDYKNSSKLLKRDVNESVVKAEKAINNFYDAGYPFESIKFEDAWESSTPSMIEYIKNKETVYANTSHEFLAHSLGILYDMIIAHKQSKNKKYLIKGYEIINDWFTLNSRFNIFQSPLVWNDHIASERIMAILLFNDYARQHISLDTKNKDMINEITNDSILFLASPYNYKNKHNHGIFQDFALLTSAEYLQNKEQKKRYFKIAIDRFKQQVFETYDSNGVHLENSPGYHLGITDLLNDFVLLVKKLDLTIDSETLNIIELANRNKYFFVLNNGNVPPVGDSQYKRYNSFEEQKDEVLVSQDAGYLILKDKNFYLLIRTQSVNSAHRHQDQLSFIYEYQKDLIISEPGFLDYSSSKETIFVRSREAHNTVYSEDKKKTNYYFNKTLNNEQFFYCQILSTDKSISRTFLLDKKLKVLVIQDIIKTNAEEKLFEVLNLSSDVVKVNNNKNFQEIYMANKHKYYIGLFHNEDYRAANILYGSKKPYFGGWRTIPYKNLVPSYTLLTELDKKKNIKLTSVISVNEIESFSDKNNSTAVTIWKDNIVYDLNSIKQQSNRNLTTNVNDLEYKSYTLINKVIDKVKKKISPIFYKRIKIFIYESLIIIFTFLLYIIFRKSHTRLFVWLTVAAINLFNVLVFIVG